jgi:hypothetical protein
MIFRCISVNYAMKKDGKGERHGTAAGIHDFHTSLTIDFRTSISCIS